MSQLPVSALVGTWRSCSDDCLYQVRLSGSQLLQSRCCDRRPAKAGGPDPGFGPEYPVDAAAVSRVVSFRLFIPESDG